MPTLAALRGDPARRHAPRFGHATATLNLRRASGVLVVDVHETPAVPEFDAGGDARLGWYLAGALLILVGWGVGVLANVVAHARAPAAGLAIGPWHVYAQYGLFAEVTLGIGLFAGAIGAGLVWLAYRTPPGPLRLPGYPY